MARGRRHGLQVAGRLSNCKWPGGWVVADLHGPLRSLSGCTTTTQLNSSRSCCWPPCAAHRPLAGLARRRRCCRLLRLAVCP